MKNWLSSIFILILISCHQEINNKPTDSTKAIPINSDLIIRLDNINKISEKMETFMWWNKLKEVDFFSTQIKNLNEINKVFKFNNLPHSKPIYISSTLFNKDNPSLLLTTSIAELETSLTQLINQKSNLITSTSLYEEVEIKQIKITHTNQINFHFFYAIHHGVLMLSFSEILIQESIRQFKRNENLFHIQPVEKLDQNLPKYSDINLLVKTAFLEQIIGHKNIFLNSKTWSLFDVEIDEESLLLTGVTNRGDITYLKNSKYSDAKKSNIESIMPRHIKGFYNYQINNHSDLNEVMNIIVDGPHKNNYHLSYEQWKPKEINTAYNHYPFDNISYLIFQPTTKKECLKNLKSTHDNLDVPETYTHYQIHKINPKKLNIEGWFNQITKNWNNIYYIMHEQHVITSDSKKKLKSLINNISSHQTMETTNALNKINAKMGGKSHTSFHLNFTTEDEKWHQVFNSVASKNIGSSDYFFNSICFLYKNKDVENVTIWNFNLKHEIQNKPQIVKNHYTNEMEIFAQDINHHIYLIDKDGDLIWTKELGHKIIGNVHQIDMYKNNKLQYLFNTTDSIYVIDRNGQNVQPFPLKSQYPMSIPLALFDYDKVRNYRILVPMGNHLNMYNQKGEIVSGWKLKKTNTNITCTPEHFQLFNTDYIIISEEDGTLNILNRRGENRLLIEEKVYRSTHPINLMKGPTIETSKMTTVDQEGKIIQFLFDGTVSNLNPKSLEKVDTYIQQENYTIITKNETLSYSSKENQFDYNFKYGSLSRPTVFHYHDSLFIAVKHNETNLIYILNKSGAIHKRPFFGTTDFNIGSINSKENLSLLVGSYEGFIYNYIIN